MIAVWWRQGVGTSSHVKHPTQVSDCFYFIPPFSCCLTGMRDKLIFLLLIIISSMGGNHHRCMPTIFDPKGTEWWTIIPDTTMVIKPTNTSVFKLTAHPCSCCAFYSLRLQHLHHLLSPFKRTQSINMCITDSGMKSHSRSSDPLWWSPNTFSLQPDRFTRTAFE